MSSTLRTTELSEQTRPPTGPSAAVPPATASQSIWRRIRRDVILLGAGNIGIVVAQLCFRGILITALVPAAYGRLSLILSIYNTVWILGASGLPNAVARYLSISSPANDAAVIRSAIRAGAGPIAVAAALIATAAGVLLESPVAGLFGAIGLVSLVYSLLTMGILRGRGRVGLAASIMPIAGVCELTPLAILWRSGIGVTPLSAFGCFCLGNVLGLLVGTTFARRTSPHRSSHARYAREQASSPVPSPRQLLGFSMWLGAATAGVAVLPLIIRSAAAVESYTVVAIIDVAIVLFSIPQRVGTVIVSAVVPHATRAVNREGLDMMISRRENVVIALPFALAAAIVAFTPIMRLLFDALGRPVYAESSKYLALALLAAPARILYGVVEGVLIAHSEGRFLAITALSITLAAASVIFAAAAAGGIVVAFAVFVAAFWAIYLVGRARIGRIMSASIMSAKEPAAS
jgi:O-antigen/teichoic acid export membrane protein